MKPFFSYYGAKYTAAKHLGSPRRSFAMSARLSIGVKSVCIMRCKMSG